MHERFGIKMNCLLCGVGGQGTVLASKLLAQAAIDKGLSARSEVQKLQRQ